MTTIAVVLLDASITDGRRARGERTRLRVVEALIALVEEGDLRPSAQRVAARAGVALRTVYHHFEDIEALRSTALRLEWQRHVAELLDIDMSLGLPDRIAVVCRQRRQLFEAITPVRRAALLDESSPLIAQGLRESREILRGRIADAFEPEIRERGAEGPALLDAIDLVTSWQTWNYLRSYLNRRPTDVARTIEFALHRLLDEI
jgi:TetR/AcrR family transcriptional regulator of autoinduction and epiphytic fitness